MKKWECTICGWIYEEDAGIPEDGIPAGTRWEDIPQDWCCPECGISKANFAMVELSDREAGDGA